MTQDTIVSHPDEGKPWDVIIFGSGPAGLTAAIYTTRGAASTLLFAGEKWGGQLMLTTVVDNFPGFPDGVQGPELMEKIRHQAERFGTQIIEHIPQSVDTSKQPFEIVDNGKTYYAKAIILAMGAENKWLGVPGESALIGRGVSSCAPCDAPFFKDKKVAVVGGGDSAMEEALVLTKYASEVTIIHRRDSFKASAAMQQKVQSHPKIKIIWNSQVTKVNGEQKLESIIIEDLVAKTQQELTFDGMFVAIGHSPSTSQFASQIELDEKGYVLKKDAPGGYQMTTNKPGVFVAGDVHDYHYRQAITAAGFGAMAAIEALQYLDKPVSTW